MKVNKRNTICVFSPDRLYKTTYRYMLYCVLDYMQNKHTLSLYKPHAHCNNIMATFAIFILTFLLFLSVKVWNHKNGREIYRTPPLQAACKLFHTPPEILSIVTFTKLLWSFNMGANGKIVKSGISGKRLHDYQAKGISEWVSACVSEWVKIYLTSDQ